MPQGAPHSSLVRSLARIDSSQRIGVDCDALDAHGHFWPVLLVDVDLLDAAERRVDAIDHLSVACQPKGGERGECARRTLAKTRLTPSRCFWGA